jgi:YbgC/YbaW family acyl-CoA thioester hydrolase
MAAPFRTTRRMEFADTDMAGIVHFANFFRFMESAEMEFFRSRGLSGSMRWEGYKIGFPRVSASCDYLKPVRFEDILEITLQVANTGRKSITLTFEFSKDSEVVARGQISAVCCREGAGQEIESIPIPAEIRAKLLDAV